MLLNKRLTRVHSQKDPRLHFGESFTLTLCILVATASCFIVKSHNSPHSQHKRLITLHCLSVYNEPTQCEAHQTNIPQGNWQQNGRLPV